MFFLGDFNEGSLKERAASITSLGRLGLLDINLHEAIVDDDYHTFEQTLEYRELLEEYQGHIYEVPYIQKGSVKLTPLGEDLCFICFSDRSQ